MKCWKCALRCALASTLRSSKPSLAVPSACEQTGHAGVLLARSWPGDVVHTPYSAVGAFVARRCCAYSPTVLLGCINMRIAHYAAEIVHFVRGEIEQAGRTSRTYVIILYTCYDRLASR